VTGEGGGAGSIIPSISAPPSGYGTPTGNDSGASGSSTPATLGEVKGKADLRAREPRKDGGVVCCMGVYETCFKMGRVTVPPVSPTGAFYDVQSIHGLGAIPR
jgi:hypothetical protein